MITWVLGRGGLVGSSVEAKLHSRSTVWVPEFPIQWGNKSIFEETFKQALTQFMGRINHEEWAILWCAANSVVSSSPGDIQREGDFINFVCSQLSLLPQSQQSRGVLSFASSAGGVYGGSTGRVYSEMTKPQPLNEYGLAKLETEQQLIHFARHANIKVAIFRLANVYGPNQDLRKNQGIISVITNSILHHLPVKIYVPLQTTRNYIYADDAGEIIARSVKDFVNKNSRDPLIKLVASDRNVSLSALLYEFRNVYGRSPLVVNRISAAGAQQPINLRLRSEIGDTNGDFSYTSLAVGISRLRQSALAKNRKL